MQFDEYRDLAGRTAVSVTDENYHPQLAMCGLGVSGEAGEITDEIKKICFHDHKIDKQQLMKEMGDVLWYLAHLCRILGVSFDEVAQMNIDKLKKRYPNGFEKERSINRTD